MPEPMKVRLTDAFAKHASLPAGKTDHIFWDTDLTGFGLRVRATTQTYIAAYRPAGAGRSVPTKKFKLGSPNVMNASAARQAAKVTLGQAAAGKDPAAERAEEKRREKARVCGLLDRYEAALKKRHYVDLPGTMSTLRRNLHPLRNRDVKTVAGSEIVAIRDKLTAGGLEGAADNFFARCRAFFSWCLNQKAIDHHPTYAMRKEKRTRADKLEEGEVGRALSDEELVKVWMAALPSTTGPGDPSAFGDYVRFLILTGCRRTEASKASRTMLVDGVAGRLLVIPKRITKSGRDHNLPVTNAISTVLGRRSLERDLLFPSWKTGKPMQGWAKMLRKLAKVSGVDFTLHDLRRTFRTGLSKLRVDNDVGEICINHSRRGLEAVYNRDSSGTEMRDAFTKWSEHVEKLVHDHRWKQMRDRRYLGKKQPEPAAPKPKRNAFAELRKLSPEPEDQGAFD